MRIALVCGSVRNNSYTKNLLKQLENSLVNQDIEIDFIDFSETPLPIYDGSVENINYSSSFINRIMLADGLLIACPEYHNSFTGVLKNAFDYLSSEQIAEKPIGLVATSGGGKGGINCLNGMRLFLRGMYGLVLPEQIVIDRSDIIDTNSFTKIVELTNKVIRFSKLMQNEKLLMIKN
jgi:azobenzene reductase